MPAEGIRRSSGDTTHGPVTRPWITIEGRTVRIHLAGCLDRPGVGALVGEVAHHLHGQGWLVVLDGRRLQHLDYRCVPLLKRWRRTLRSYRHRLVIDGWNDYLRAILAMEDWDGEMEDGTPGRIWRPAGAPTRYVRRP